MSAFRPVDIASLVAFRIAFGALMLVAMLRYFWHGWIDLFFVQPTFFFSYAGLEWLQPLPAPGMHVLYALLAATAACIAVGLWYRPAAALFCVGFTYAHLIDKTNYLNHYYLLSLVAFLLTLLPANRAAAIDVLRHPERRQAAVSAWVVWLLRFQLGVVYFFGGVAKLNADWLLRAQPLRIWLGANADLPLVGPWLERIEVAYLFSYAGLLFDLGIVPFLLWRRTRLLAYGAVLVFHILTHLLFPIGMFPWVMVALTPIFFDPSWPRIVAARLRLLRGVAGAAPRQPALSRIAGATSLTPRRRLGIAVAAVYVALQVALPLRHVLYPGNVYWTEEGFRFSWQIMVMEKYGRATFHVTDTRTGATRLVDPATYLTPLQARMMATQPDMLAAFARFLADRERDVGGNPVRVTADVRVALNGRAARPFVDPAVDLAALRPAAVGSACAQTAPGDDVL